MLKKAEIFILARFPELHYILRTASKNNKQPPEKKITYCFSGNYLNNPEY